MKISERVLRRVFAAFRGVKRVCDCNRIDLVPSRGTKILLTRYIGRQDNLVPSEGTKIEYGYLFSHRLDKLAFHAIAKTGCLVFRQKAVRDLQWNSNTR